MSAGLLDLTELATRSGVPTERLRHYAETGLLPPTRRDGDRLGYPPIEVSTARMLAGAEDLGLYTDTLTGLADACDRRCIRRPVTTRRWRAARS